MIWPLKPLQMFKYGGLIIDPPWPYKMYSEKGYEKSPEAHYDTMSLEEIKALPVNELAARDCLLFLWSTAPHLAQAIDVMQAWGFTYKTFIVWHKKTVHGKDAFGTGYIVRSTAEICLVGTIGNPPINRKVSTRQRNLIQTCDIADCLPNIVEAVTREHSRKPDEFRALMERYIPDQFLAECFAREPWPGHDVWGNETEKFGVAA